MNRFSTTTAAIVASLAVGSAAAQAQEPDLDDLRNSYEAAANANDAAALAALHSEDARVLPPGAPAAEGRDAIEAHFKERFELASPSDFTITSTETRQLGDAHLDVGTYTMNATIAGTQEMSVSGNYVALVEEDTDGEWRISLQIFNEEEPAPRN